jgi:RNA polymerase sigma-70 factor, ECF subfamily
VAAGEDPQALVVARETIELAFIAAIQHLPPRQRAALILRDVVGWSANETAALLETTIASANRALQRARATLRDRLGERRTEWGAGSEPSAAERDLVRRYLEAHERADIDALAALLGEDVRLAMPPHPTDEFPGPSRCRW